METRAHHILIGLFTLIAGAAILLFVLWMTKYGDDRNYQTFDIVFREAVSGLSVGSAVQYNGIGVGEVESLTLDPDDPRQVWARVRVVGTTPIKTDTQARLTLLNITGASGIELSEGTPESPLLTSGQGGVAVIVAEPSSLARLRGDSEELILSVTTLLDSANRLLSEENAAYITRVLDNLDTVTTALAQEQDTLREGLQSLITAGQDVSGLIARFDQQTSDYAEPLLASAVQSMNNIEQMSQRLDTLLSENSQALATGMQSLNELDPAMRDLRDTMNSFSDIVNRLEADPTGFVLGGDNIREFTP
ncbi:MAG: MlaD family protein [Pseudohongiella sp.]|uniref:MlaD family protein n=1 Tax=Pseudohongiella sp. TaxID=1979412 RepID=UPI0034A01FA9